MLSFIMLNAIGIIRADIPNKNIEIENSNTLSTNSDMSITIISFCPSDNTSSQEYEISPL